MKKSFFILTLLSLCTLSVYAQKHLLQYNLEKGKKNIVMLKSVGPININANGQSMFMVQSSTMLNSLTAQAITENGYEVDFVCHHMISNTNSPMQGINQTIDTSKPDNPEAKSLAKLIDKPIKASVAKNGLMIGQCNLAAFSGTELAKVKLPGIMPIVFSKEPIAIGESWEGDFCINPMQVENEKDGDKCKFTLSAYDAKNKTYTIAVLSKGTSQFQGIPIQMEIEGTIIISSETGLPLPGSTIKVSGKAKQFIQGQDISIDMNSTTTIEEYK